MLVCGCVLTAPASCCSSCVGEEYAHAGRSTDGPVSHHANAANLQRPGTVGTHTGNMALSVALQAANGCGVPQVCRAGPGCTDECQLSPSIHRKDPVGCNQPIGRPWPISCSGALTSILAHVLHHAVAVRVRLVQQPVLGLIELQRPCVARLRAAAVRAVRHVLALHTAHTRRKVSACTPQATTLMRARCRASKQA